MRCRLRPTAAHSSGIVGTVRVAVRAALVLGALGLVAALALVLWPLHDPGVTGSPLTPHYRAFGWSGYAPLPAHPTLDDFRRDGISLPQDTVHTRRLWAGSVAAGSVLVLAASWLGMRRSRAE